MKRLILGQGKVSQVIKKSADVITSRSECDITDLEDVVTTISEYNPDVVINCAAKTNLEYCQDNKVESFKSNTLGLLNVLTGCSDLGVKLVHISSGCLFDGNNEISTENSRTTPSVWYTWTKAWADEIIQSYGYDNTLVLRPRQLISKVPHPSNLLTKFSSMKCIEAIDEPNSITCIEDFSEMIDHLLDIDATGIFNCSNEGTISPLDIALRIRETIAPELSVKKIEYEDLLRKLPNRRVNTVLSNKKLKAAGYNPRPAKEALDWCLKNYES